MFISMYIIEDKLQDTLKHFKKDACKVCMYVHIFKYVHVHIYELCIFRYVYELIYPLCFKSICITILPHDHYHNID